MSVQPVDYDTHQDRRQTPPNFFYDRADDPGVEEEEKDFPPAPKLWHGLALIAVFGAAAGVYWWATHYFS